MNKKLTRLTALLLAMLLLMSTLGTALADSTLTRGEYGQALQKMQDDLNLIPTDAEITKQVTVTGTKLVPVTAAVDGELAVDGSIVLTNPETAADAYQWQIEVDGAWASIAGETGEMLTLTYAMAVNAVNEENAVVLRRLHYDAEGMLLEECDEFVIPVNDKVEYKPEPTASTMDVTQYTKNETPGAEYDAAWDFQNTARNPVSTFALTREGDAPVLRNYNIVINYLFEDNQVVTDPYTATVAEKTNFSTTVKFPTIQGYLPYFENDTESTTSKELNIQNIQDHVTYNVYYKPTNVNYTVRHYQQNVDNDNYTLAWTETLQGLTASEVPEVSVTKRTAPAVPAEISERFEGFYSLLYENPAIAADGSTTVEVYYDRNYYLMLFDLDEGYGVDPIYARYGADIGTVENPTKAGWTFMGWSATEGGTTPAKLPETMPASESGKITYYAIWGEPLTVKYTVVYWRENADDDGYSYWGSEIKEAKAGTLISGSDSVPTSVSNDTVDGNTVDEKPYFTYNSILTDKNVEIKGDGTSIVNVYYTRNEYTIYFYGYGTCARPVHTHGENCKPELVCGLTEHTHSDECCDAVHTHDTSCWNNVGSRQNNTNGYPTAPQNGQLYVYEQWGMFGSITVRRIYINGSWYSYNANSGSNGQIIQPRCSGVHVHGDGDCNCNMREHSHSNSCYGYDCGLEEHTHSNNCNSNRTDNVIYILTAKYNQNISTLWPTYDVLKADGHAYKDNSGNVENASGDTFRGWDVDGVSAEAVSKRVNMTSDLCDTSDGEKNATAQYDTEYTVYLYYMFESFDQTSDANGNERKQYTFTQNYRNDTRYYDSDPRYYQVVNANNPTFGQKQIMGMNPVGVQSEQVGGYNSNTYNNFLYYTRNRYTLTFQNVDKVAKTVSDIMFEQPLNGYKAQDGTIVSEYRLDNVADYPAGFEKDAYEFAGWYTTPECYEGTEFKFTDETIMPYGDLTLYAKWAPIKRTVTFYLDEKDMGDGQSDIANTHKPLEVPHGSIVSGTLEDPTNGGYSFVGWFYKDENGVEKAFDFENMRVSSDLEVYGKWSSNVLKKYTVYFKIKGTDIEVADPITGSTLAGLTKTFDAKGDTELKPEYQAGYFPEVQSHSLTLNINDPDNEGANTYTFEYVQKDAVPYTVYYVAEKLKDGANPEDYKTIDIDGKTYYMLLDPPYTNSENRKAVVTEQFEVVPGYMPDAYQKRLVVSTNEAEKNKIVFYYKVDSVHAYYKITHFTQNTDGVNWSEYASTQLEGTIGETYEAAPLTIDGFTYDPTVEGTVVNGKLPAEGMELKLYYKRNSYPYEVRYLEEVTGKQLADPKKSNGLYGAVVSENAISITDYTPVDPTSQTLTIRIEESQTVAKLNIITFYYGENDVTINYKVVGPTGCGTVDLNDGVENKVTETSESVKVKTGEAKGATAAVSSNEYKFVGWYDTNGNKLSEQLAYAPGKGTDGKNVAATYYAKFEWNISTLTITKTGMAAGEQAIFTVEAVTANANGTNSEKTFTIVVPNNGSVTIPNVVINSAYTVTELTDWTWRYTSTATDDRGTIEPDGSTASFKNTPTNDKWLDGNAYADNEWTDGSVALDKTTAVNATDGKNN